MIRALRFVVDAVRSVALFEITAAGLFIAAAATQFGTSAALATGGVMAALKSYELDQ